MDFRVNDEVVKGEAISRDAFTDLTLKKVNSSVKGETIGLSQIIRLSLDNIAIESTDEQMGYFPFDGAKISLNFDFYPIKQMFIQDDDGKLRLYNKEKDIGVDANKVDYWEIR